MDKPSFANILKNINMSSNDFFYNENKNYLHNLANSLKQIINILRLIYISDISATYTKHIQPVCTRTTDSNDVDYFYCETQPEQKQINNLATELEDIIVNINLLMANIPCYLNMDKLQLKNLSNELIIFHNNVVNKIKGFLDLSTEYSNQLETISKFLETKSEKCKLNLQKIKMKRNNKIFNSIGTIGLELLANSNGQAKQPNTNLVTNTLDVYEQQLLTSNQINQLEFQFEKINEYLAHYSE